MNKGRALNPDVFLTGCGNNSEFSKYICHVDTISSCRIYVHKQRGKSLFYSPCHCSNTSIIVLSVLDARQSRYAKIPHWKDTMGRVNKSAEVIM